MHFAVCGLHLRNGPLNHQLVSLGGKFLRSDKTSPNYTMHALSSAGSPTKPGLILHPTGAATAAPQEIEVWDMPDASVGTLLSYVPSPLGFGTVLLHNADKVYGFTCEGWAADQAKATAMGISTLDISHYGGWAAYAKDTDAAAK